MTLLVVLIIPGIIGTGINPITGKIRKEGPLINDINEIRGHTLGCWCKPNKCHGDIIIKLLNE